MQLGNQVLNKVTPFSFNLDFRLTGRNRKTQVPDKEGQTAKRRSEADLTLPGECSVWEQQEDEVEGKVKVKGPNPQLNRKDVEFQSGKQILHFPQLEEPAAANPRANHLDHQKQGALYRKEKDINWNGEGQKKTNSRGNRKWGIRKLQLSEITLQISVSCRL